MGLVLNAILITLGVTVIGGGGMFLLYLRTRPKKETWDAYIYGLGQGVSKPVVKNGKVVSKLELKDLRAISTDVLEKIEQGPGLTTYRLQKANKVTSQVTNEIVEYWGEGKRTVNLLHLDGEYTFLKKGYDTETGKAIFRPLPNNTINMIKSEMALRKERLTKEKDILQAITPWIVFGIGMLGLVAVMYVGIGGAIEIAEINERSTENMLEIVQGPVQKNTPVEPTPPENLGSQENIPLVEDPI